MRNEVKVQVKPNYVSKFKKGYPLIFKEALANSNQLQEEGNIVNLMDEQGRFLAKGYYGRQNKGYGWILSKKENEKIDAAFFEKKMKAALERRLRIFQDEETTAYRVFNGEGDGIGGLVVDYYDGFYVIQWYSKGIYQFKAEIVKALEKTAGIKGIYEKKRFDTKGKYVEDDDFVSGQRGEFPLLVKENGVHFAVYLNDGAMVGVFLDQREVRKRIRDSYANGKRVLNMFSYTGAFSIFAALGGAEKTVSVDVANRSLEKTKEQMAINNIDFTAHDIIVEDVFKYFKYAVRKQLLFDLVILDPPSFAKTKKHTFSAAKDYKDLLNEAIAITEEGGVIVASTNCSTFDMKKFKGFASAAFKESGCKYVIREEYELPNDFQTIKEFPEGNYLKVLFLQKLAK